MEIQKQIEAEAGFNIIFININLKFFLGLNNFSIFIQYFPSELPFHMNQL